jgi:hypothetical protein
MKRKGFGEKRARKKTRMLWVIQGLQTSIYLVELSIRFLAKHLFVGRSSWYPEMLAPSK